MAIRQGADPIYDVAEVVRSARRDHHFTQAQLAERAQVSRGFVVELEKGHSRAELGKVLMVFRALDLDLVHPAQHGEQSTVSSLALIEKGQQLAGHQPSPEALDRAGRVLAGETSVDDARAELEAKYGHLRTR